MSRNELEQRVALALYGETGLNRERCLDLARAALKAHEEWLLSNAVTERASEAGRQSLRDSGLMPAFTDKGGPDQRPLLETFLREAWPKMISAAHQQEG